MNRSQKESDTKIDSMMIKIKTLQKEVATLSKSGKRQSQLSKELSNAGSGSGTDSPSLI